MNVNIPGDDDCILMHPKIHSLVFRHKVIACEVCRHTKGGHQEDLGMCPDTKLLRHDWRIFED